MGSATAKGNTAGAGVGVGAAVGLNVMVNSASAELVRGVDAASTVTVKLISDSDSQAAASAGAVGITNPLENDLLKDKIKSADGTVHQWQQHADNWLEEFRDRMEAEGHDPFPPLDKVVDALHGQIAKIPSIEGELAKAKDKAAVNGADAPNGGVHVATALAVNVANSSNHAAIAEGVHVKSDDSIWLTARLTTRGRALTDSHSLDVMPESVNVGAAVGLNVATFDNTARVGTGAILEGKSIEIEAGMVKPEVGDRTPKPNQFTARALSAGAGAGMVGVAGSVGVNIVTGGSYALVMDGANLTSTTRGKCKKNPNAEPPGADPEELSQTTTDTR